VNYGGMGVHTQVSAFTDAYLDRAYSEANGLSRNGKAYIYDSNQSVADRSEDILATTQQAPEQQTMRNFNFHNMNDEALSNFGISKNDPEFEELSNLAANVDFNSTDENVKSTNVQYENKLIDYVLPSAANALLTDPEATDFDEGINELRASFDVTDANSIRENLRKSMPSRLPPKVNNTVIQPIQQMLIKGLQLNQSLDGSVIGPNISFKRAEFMVKEFMYTFDDQGEITGLSDNLIDAIIARIQQGRG
jgi:hypothetical protein